MTSDAKAIAPNFVRLVQDASENHFKILEQLGKVSTNQDWRAAIAPEWQHWLDEADRIALPRDVRKFVEYYYEELHFFLYLIGWSVSQKLGRERGAAFRDALVVAVAETLYPEMDSQGIKSPAEFCEIFVTEYNTRADEWFQFKDLYPGEGKPLKATLLWEHSNSMLARFFPNLQRDVVPMEFLISVTLRLLKNLTDVIVAGLSCP